MPPAGVDRVSSRNIAFHGWLLVSFVVDTDTTAKKSAWRGERLVDVEEFVHTEKSLAK
jgi:hypothetical protein